MKTKVEHTPLPWKVKGSFILKHKTESIVGINQYLPSSETIANASFIVRACNNYHELLEACKIASDYFFSKNLADTANTVKEIINQAISNTEKEE